MAKTRGTGLLMVWADIDPEFEAEYHRRYDEEHFASLLAVPGVSESEPWAKARDGNPWSRRIRAFMRHDVGSPGIYRRIYPQ